MILVAVAHVNPGFWSSQASKTRIAPVPTGLLDPTAKLRSAKRVCQAEETIMPSITSAMHYIRNEPARSPPNGRRSGRQMAIRLLGTNQKCRIEPPAGYNLSLAEESQHPYKQNSKQANRAIQQRHGDNRSPCSPLFHHFCFGFLSLQASFQSIGSKVGEDNIALVPGRNPNRCAPASFGCSKQTRCRVEWLAIWQSTWRRTFPRKRERGWKIAPAFQVSRLPMTALRHPPRDPLSKRLMLAVPPRHEDVGCTFRATLAVTLVSRRRRLSRVSVYVKPHTPRAQRGTSPTRDTFTTLEDTTNMRNIVREVSRLEYSCLRDGRGRLKPWSAELAWRCARPVWRPAAVPSQIPRGDDRLDEKFKWAKQTSQLVGNSVPIWPSPTKSMLKLASPQCCLKLGHDSDRNGLTLWGQHRFEIVGWNLKRFEKASFDEVDFGGFWRCGVVGRKKASRQLARTVEFQRSADLATFPSKYNHSFQFDTLPHKPQFVLLFIFQAALRSRGIIGYSLIEHIQRCEMIKPDRQLTQDTFVQSDYTLQQVPEVEVQHYSSNAPTICMLNLSRAGYVFQFNINNLLDGPNSMKNLDFSPA
ncbi:uncharacterized protein CLUP02_13721 [Colletotrichum lupini]|uniref:Uncharacterized protein n=1 Tax=Colletotrichum lupini TaxID=145971 RepID=A0A9Q8T300_9PEZI|nr:uncharacterized protein CLUP02_13721 [Colletotrichum lupini]UQC88198.1 hypothetical protein CLUP02_13721 [Colletotrichum lupini]